MKQFIILILVAALGVGGLVWWRNHTSNRNAPSFRTTPVEQGDLFATISATGTLEPEDVVDVGAQVAGRIDSFGRDLKDSTKSIDFNSEVEAGTILAEIDKRLYKADVDSAEGQLKQAMAQDRSAHSQVDVADANVNRAKADLDQMRSRFVQNEREWQRTQRLSSRPGTVSDQDLDTARANYETARDAVKVGEATIKQMEASAKAAKSDVDRTAAGILTAQAALDKVKTNLEFCTIKSPVKGTIIDRRVNVGQTVVSTQNSPSLFLIARDLRKMQIWTSVNEADVGQIRVGQKTRFTLDGLPGRVFAGEVTQVRLNATVTQNVVTYTVIVTTDNKDGALRAYQTANVTFQIDERKDVLKVANGALRWQPRPEMVDPEHKDDLARLVRQRSAPKAGTTEKDLKEGVLWIETEKSLVRPIKVRTGLSDGQMTEIITEELSKDDRVIVGMQQAKGNGGEEANPFQPKMFNGTKKP